METRGSRQLCREGMLVIAYDDKYAGIAYPSTRQKGRNYGRTFALPTVVGTLAAASNQLQPLPWVGFNLFCRAEEQTFPNGDGLVPRLLGQKMSGEGVFGEFPNPRLWFNPLSIN